MSKCIKKIGEVEIYPEDTQNSGRGNNKMSTERFNLTWDQFEASVGNSFRDLLNDKDFADVTLVTEDDEQIKAHKVVLSTCSPVFKNILIKNHHQHPLQPKSFE